MRRFIQAVHLTGSIKGTTNYHVDAMLVSEEVFHEKIKEGLMRGQLARPITQSTGFGYRTVWDKKFND